MAAKRAHKPACDRAHGTRYQIDGFVGELAARVVRNWVLPAPRSNPGMLDMIRDRDRAPARDLVMWAGEFAGKYLTSAVQMLRLTADPELAAHLPRFVAELLATRDARGYLGPWPPGYELTNTAPNVEQGAHGRTWDTWGHYHVMLGLLLYAAETGDRRALAATRAVADQLVERFGEGRARLVDTGWTEMNLAPVHALALLFQRSGDRRHLDLALRIVEEFSATGSALPREAPVPLAGDYLAGALAGKRFHELPRPRWESLHPIMGLAELYYVTGRTELRTAFEHLWRSIRDGDRHNNGGFSSGEKATGNPYDRGPIETCCTVAWIALSVEMLRLTGDPTVADELELSTLNSGVGMHEPTGRWATYNTPMDGVRRAATQDIAFQAREGTPELNCCSVNAPRGLGMITDWAAVRAADGAVVLNWLGPSVIRVPLGEGRAVTLEQETRYPADGKITVRVTPTHRERLSLRIRVPAWSEHSRASLEGQPLPASAGTYLEVERVWNPGDAVQITLDMRPHVWHGEHACAAMTSVYRGPLLLTWDRRMNTMDPDDLPPLDLEGAGLRRVAATDSRAPAFLWETRGTDGRPVHLCDFGSAGSGGSPYRSWLPLAGGQHRRSPFAAP